MKDFEKHLTPENYSIKEALLKLGSLERDTILFVTNDSSELVGSVTDGDLRRGLLKGLSIDHQLKDVMNTTPKFLVKGSYSIDDVVHFRNQNYKLIPLVDQNKKIINILNFRLQKSFLPVDAVIMAGGLGSRLRPLTNTVPKPLLQIGGKEIISYNFDRLYDFGIKRQHITINYLGEQLVDYCSKYNDQIDFNLVKENEFLGTAGSMSLIDEFDNDTILLMNSDLLTNIDYEDFYQSFLRHKSDIMVASIPYTVDLPYAIFELEEKEIKSFKEKPSYTYYANAGIYLIKKDIVKEIPKNTFFNATDLMQLIIDSGKKLAHYPIRSYWLDIGKHEDFEKAQKDIKHITF